MAIYHEVSVNTALNGVFNKLNNPDSQGLHISLLEYKAMLSVSVQVFMYYAMIILITGYLYSSIVVNSFKKYEISYKDLSDNMNKIATYVIGENKEYFIIKSFILDSNSISERGDSLVYLNKGLIQSIKYLKWKTSLDKMVTIV